MAFTSSSISVPAVVPMYDVFLSFRGEDTRNSFVDHLYEALVRAGVSTFRDNDGIRIGQKLKLEIERAIRESRSSIVVLSKEYASSIWCLDELVLILKQSRISDHFVLPVFYHVEPSDVRNQRKSFVIKPVEGSSRTEDNVNRWKEALREVAGLKGMVLSGLETKFIAEIVETICDKLLPAHLAIPTPRRLDVYQNKNLDYIMTQKSSLGDIITALEKDSIQIVGIYGLGGVGKTTLAMEVGARVTNKFAYVAFTTVSQSVNLKKVQKDIREATKRIMKGETVLIILDDVWDKLNLEELCIPCGSIYKNCKILLTSRSEDVCTKMNAQTKICVDPLSLKEVWVLFKHVVGGRVETDFTLKPVAMEVAKVCGGLPLLVQAIGSALKDKNIKSWNYALTQLKEHEPLNIDADIKKAYIHLKLSYDYLESEEAKSCFLLCSMFPEDKKILLKDLVYLGVGLEKFNKLKSMNDARDRVQNAVNILTSSGLLLNMNDDGNEYTKMHDVVRDVALLIASEGNNKFLVEAGKGLSEWLPRKDSLESYTGISLMFNKIRKLPDYELHLPHLNTFLIPGNGFSTISNEFIGGMKEARVLDISWNEISSLPQSLKLLTKLRMLDVRGNESLDEISILGELKDLEILILSKTGITEIPKEIGDLVNLRRFDVSKCQHLCHISPGVLLKLCWLEELCIGFYSMQDDGIHDSLVEVSKLWKLTYLELVVPCSDVIPKRLTWGKSNGFVIEIGGYRKNTFGSVSERCLVVCYDTDHPNISLESIENMNNILGDLYHKGIHDINDIYLIDLPNVRCLVDWDAYISHFSNLVTLSIYGCPNLERVFSVSVAKGLVSLKKLTIVNCHVVKEVIWGGDANIIIVFPSLAKISLIYLQSLESFCSGNSTIKYPSLVAVSIDGCKSMKKWGNGIQETPKLKFVDEIPLENTINDVVMKSYQTRVTSRVMALLSK